MSSLRSRASISATLVLVAGAVAQGVLVQGALAQGADPEGAGAGLEYARLEQKVELQVFPTDHSPRYAESLPAGSVVKVRNRHEGYREIIMPLGVLGFVHKKFTTPIEDGAVKSQPPKLAFRYRAQTGEAPVAIVEQGTEFRVAEDHGDWWLVRYAAGSAWVPAASLLTFDPGAVPESIVASYEELGKLQREACDATWQAVLDQREADRRLEEFESTLEALRERFRAELEKPPAEQSYDSIRTAVDALIATTDAEEPAHAVATRFREKVELQVTFVEAVRVADAEPKPASVDVPDPRPKPDPLSHFTAIGWIRIDGDGNAALMKGEQILHELSCTLQRYDLAMFDGLEVGVRGPTSRKTFESIRTLDVERIEVLHAPKPKRR